ncbi:MAG: multiheme c-type cytochrome [Kofleriaceae bacterium]
MIVRIALLAVVSMMLVGCGDEVYPVSALQDPSTCKDCHATHYQEWSGSMHAYATDDPVFVAMNKRGQREAQLGTFCINCHAPMAVVNGTITDANAADFDLSTLPATERGVTCYFCHNVASVVETHNNGLVIANDQTMRGGVKDPADNPAHHSRYDELMDSDVNESEMCGSCHDIITPRGVAVERTFAEWRETIFAKEKDPLIHNSCGSCHMRSRDDVIADGPGLDVSLRRNGFHEHRWQAIDEALTPWPETEAMAQAVQEDLDGSIAIVGPTPLTSPHAPGGICLDPPGVLSIRVDSIGTGHSWPSGAAQDRRAWLEVIAYDANDQIVFSSGVVPDGMDPEQINDPNLLGLWDRTKKDDGTPAHMFWEVATIDSQLLKGPTTRDPFDPAYDHSVTKQYTIGPAFSQIDRITARMRIRPLPFELIHSLEASGDLAPGIASQIKTLDVAGATRTWLRSTAGTGASINTNCNPQ